MKALFIRPADKRILPGETPRYEMTFAGPYPPLGMMSVATCVNEWSEHTAQVLDAAVLGMSELHLGRTIKRMRPDVVGLSAVTFTLLDALATAKMVKSIDPDIPVVMGGVHAHLFPTQTVNLPPVDFVVRGDGERAFPDLLDCLEGKRAIGDTPGVVGIREGKVVRGKPPEPLHDLDALPPVDRTLIPYKKYYSPFSEQKPWTIVTSARGCPHRCSFCYRPLKFQGAAYRECSPERVVEEMRSCAELGIKEVTIYDDTFTANRRRIMRFCELMRGENLDIIWDIRTRPDCVDRELLQTMKEVGLRRVQMGAESGTQEGLDIIQKDLTVKQNEDAFSLVRELKLDSFGYFMIGLPGETRERMRETIRFALKLDPDYANFTVFIPLPGSPFWDRLAAEGDTSVRASWERFAASPSRDFDAPTCNGLHTKEELLRILDSAWKAFYLRPRFFLREVCRIRSIGVLNLKTRTIARLVRSLAKEYIPRGVEETH